MLLLAVSCGLLAGALTLWRVTPLAATTLAPIATTLLCLGVALLNTVYWRPYRYATLLLDEQRRQASVISGVMTLAVMVAVGNLALQLVGALLVATVGWAAWVEFSPNSYLAAAFAGFVTSAVSFVVRGGAFTWRPQRDPVMPMSALGPPARGVRRLLRWLVMGVPAYGLPLTVVAPFTLFISYGDLTGGSPDALPRLRIAALFGVAAAFFLLAALGELTNPERAPALEEPGAE